jgi:hypothetical protein
LNPDHPSTAPDAAAHDAAAGAAGAPAAERAEYVWLYEKRKRIYARAVSGWFARWRWAMVWATQLVFYGLPWLEWNARQAALFDLEMRPPRWCNNRPSSYRAEDAAAPPPAPIPRPRPATSTHRVESLP